MTLLGLTTFVLGLFAGSMLTEAVILVPYWRSMEAKTFFDLHSTLGPQLYRYFAPLTIAATLIPTATAIFFVWRGGSMGAYPTWSSLSMLATLGIYFLYFKAANESFATGSAGVAGLAAELRRWWIWQWIRTVIALGAFGLSILAVAGI